MRTATNGIIMRYNLVLKMRLNSHLQLNFGTQQKSIVDLLENTVKANINQSVEQATVSAGQYTITKLTL